MLIWVEARGGGGCAGGTEWGEVVKQGESWRTGVRRTSWCESTASYRTGTGEHGSTAGSGGGMSWTGL